MPHRFRIIVMALLSLLTCVAAYARPLAPYPTATLTVGGSEVAANTGSITIDFNGYLETVTYGQYSTPASLASALAAMFCRDYMAFGLYAKAQANGTPAYVITFQLVNGQDFAPINIVNGSSFTFIPSGFASSTATVADTGTATLNVNGVAITTGYGDGSNGQSIAEGLQDEANRIQALNPNALPVVVTAQGNNLYIQSKQTTGSFNYNYNLSFSTSLSFSSSPSSGTLTNTTNAAPVPVYSYTVGYDGTGNVTSLSDSVMGSWSYANGYDGLNRLVAGSASSGPYAGQYLCWSYDNFGNRTSQSVSTTPCGSSPPTTFAATYSANNQISTVSSPAGLSIGYEPSGSGNIINDGYNTYLYDGENRICAVNGPEGMVGYQYDADGNRIGKGTITTMSCDLTQNGYQPTSDYVLDLNGEQLTEVAIAGGVPGWQHTNVTADGMLITTYDNAGLHFYLNDPLGTRRAQTDQAGFPEQTCQSLPFGDQLYCTGSLTSPTEHHFTGKERDAESGLDYFISRYYGSSMGRFMSPDDGEDQDTVNPQSWNLYSYGRNNPLIGIDADGHTYNVCDANGKNCSNIDDKTFEAEQKKDQANGVNYSKGSITDSSGAKQGTYSHDPDIAGNPAANIAAMGNIGNQGMGAIKAFTVGSVVGGVTGGLGLSALGTGAGLTTLGDLSLNILTNQEAGAIIGWGTGQAQAGVAVTEQLAANLTAEDVAGMEAKGLNPATAQKLLNVYERAVAAGKAGGQAMARRELMIKIVQLMGK